MPKLRDDSYECAYCTEPRRIENDINSDVKENILHVHLTKRSIQSSQESILDCCS